MTASTKRNSHPGVVVIGASAGAVEALSLILPALPADYPAPVVCAVHVAADRVSLLATVFGPKCKLEVHEAEDKRPLERAIYFAPPGYHLLLERNGTLALSVDAPVWFSRPSIDVLFESAAEAYGAALVGVLLTGANHDGAAGLAAIHQAGGRTLVQTPESALAPAMPAAALSLFKPTAVVPLQQMATFLAELRFPTASSGSQS